MSSNKDLNSDLTKTGIWLTYYDILVKDIQFAKSQIWRLVYYIVLLYAAIFYLSNSPHIGTVGKYVLFFSSFLLAYFGSYYLLGFYRDIDIYRKKLEDTRLNLPCDLGKIARPESTDPKHEKLKYLLLIVIWISFFLVVWAMGTFVGIGENIGLMLN
jgi:hypothetical protein